ncbi:hypothetical protein [Legionella impletisoli]|uniref:Coiled coil protein n=1 Tax=Legionella impletisoli TaxID=343510 RepID=A0A917NCJ7_9GAMM|nr:hypothetical protein [Legionella impletisoli]GGI89337.1 hypothetical protein GCM10007966_17600 [Legionella impletisoli]
MPTYTEALDAIISTKVADYKNIDADNFRTLRDGGLFEDEFSPEALTRDDFKKIRRDAVLERIRLGMSDLTPDELNSTFLGEKEDPSFDYKTAFENKDRYGAVVEYYVKPKIDPSQIDSIRGLAKQVIVEKTVQDAIDRMSLKDLLSLQERINSEENIFRILQEMTDEETAQFATDIKVEPESFKQFISENINKKIISDDLISIDDEMDIQLKLLSEEGLTQEQLITAIELKDSLPARLQAIDSAIDQLRETSEDLIVKRASVGRQRVTFEASITNKESLITETAVSLAEEINRLYEDVDLDQMDEAARRALQAKLETQRQSLERLSKHIRVIEISDEQKIIDAKDNLEQLEKSLSTLISDEVLEDHHDASADTVEMSGGDDELETSSSEQETTTSPVASSEDQASSTTQRYANIIMEAHIAGRKDTLGFTNEVVKLSESREGITQDPYPDRALRAVVKQTQPKATFIGVKLEEDHVIRSSIKFPGYKDQEGNVRARTGLLVQNSNGDVFDYSEPLADEDQARVALKQASMMLANYTPDPKNPIAVGGKDIRMVKKLYAALLLVAEEKRIPGFTKDMIIVDTPGVKPGLLTSNKKFIEENLIKPLGSRTEVYSEYTKAQAVQRQIKGKLEDLRATNPTEKVGIGIKSDETLDVDERAPQPK